ncbi:acid phosphatase/vanadium-dependent haloperoxidase-related protein [Actinidia rufa]|uniref:Acid phosphatase/vanadium-dependent haloperoxidase-related protein n=1 Tax=Actinidia rufa TaxID=165716 RepID=A0A7J0G2D4_9ERIC|nr:acid phosphatase/vanadium-dependent haloperoxidase-related protein [Actinidia rufa]
MVSSGGMPSSHSATVTALAAAIGLQDGTGGSAFAIAVVLGERFGFTLANNQVLLKISVDTHYVMYDASGVRLHAGRQAELLNQIVCELPPEHPVSSVKPLRDSLGHTPLQVSTHDVPTFWVWLLTFSADVGVDTSIFQTSGCRHFDDPNFWVWLLTFGADVGVDTSYQNVFNHLFDHLGN